MYSIGYYLGSNQSNVIYRASTPVVSPSFSPTSPTNIDSSDAKFQISEGVVVAIIVGFIIVALVVMLFLFKRHRWKAEAEMNPKSKDYINRSEIYLPERNSSRGAKQDRDILDRLSESSQPNHDMVVKSNGINERLIQPVVPIAQPLYINTSNGTNQYHDKGLQV
jgi:large-conductance mechanosensitive channel